MLFDFSKLQEVRSDMESCSSMLLNMRIEQAKAQLKMLNVGWMILFPFVFETNVLKIMCTTLVFLQVINIVTHSPEITLQ